MAAASEVGMSAARCDFQKLGVPLDEPHGFRARQVQLPAKEYFDRAACLLACRDKWFESSQLGSTLALFKRLLTKVDFFQNGQKG